jgi:hypothetical protein
VVMAGLALAGVRYDKWIRFMLPLMVVLAVACLVMLGIAALVEGPGAASPAPRTGSSITSGARLSRTTR